LLLLFCFVFLKMICIVYMFISLLALLAAAAPGDACDYVNSTYILNETNLVKDCFDTYEVSDSFIEAFTAGLERAGEIYVFADIARNPPQPIPGIFNVIDYDSGLAAVKDAFSKSNNLLKNIVRPAQAFVDQYHDKHFNIQFSQNAENIFATVNVYLPFNWDLHNDDENTASVRLSLNQWSEIFLDNETRVLISSKKDLAVTKIDDRDAYEFFTDFFGVYNAMKWPQAKLQFARMMADQGFPLLEKPLDDDILFNEHTITYSDDQTFTFKFGFMNSKNAAVKESQKDSALVPCGHIDGMNYMMMGTFLNFTQFSPEILDCFETFKSNNDPITVIFSQSYGGAPKLEQFLETLLMPNSDGRIFYAARKTNYSKQIIVNFGTLKEFANQNESCQALTDLEKAYEPTFTDHFGSVEHVRTAKYPRASKDLLSKYVVDALNHARKPTDILIATDGFCFSACSEFVYNIIRQGSAIVVGYGSTHPNDTQYAAAQCPALTVSIGDVFRDLNLTTHGISIRVTNMENYNISLTMNETIPSDYELFRINKHIGYYDNPLNPVIEDMIPYLKSAHEDYLTNCDPLNRHLLLVNDECKQKMLLEDPNTLFAGYPCGGDGKWDNTTCLISSCKPGYAVDFDTNKCVVNDCDPRPQPSSGSTSTSGSTGSGSGGSGQQSNAITVSPMTIMIMSIFFILALFI